MRLATHFSGFFIALLASIPAISSGQESKRPELRVLSCEDFEVTGDGSNPAWKQSDWVPMQVRPKSAHDYKTQFKMLYSKTGVYVLFDGADKRITATKTEDYLDLWTEDVHECFFWTDEQHPIYFEYEVSPLGYELPILVPNFDGKFLGWRPWHIGKPSQDRLTRKAISARDGQAKSDATVSGWSAEVFIPYELLKPLNNTRPAPGTKWRANFYRMDYDGAVQGSWDWARVGTSFHEYQSFGTIVFQ